MFAHTPSTSEPARLVISVYCIPSLMFINSPIPDGGGSSDGSLGGGSGGGGSNGGSSAGGLVVVDQMAGVQLVDWWWWIKWREFRLWFGWCWIT